ncbi:MAG: glycosyltransferase [Proteobacteria bacterium]|nr:glycosyltransferase [Pseudomonadota bacterium]
MPAARVSVIIPVYNDIEFLPRALASIARQTLRPAEVLICDDGSPDKQVWEYLQSLGDNVEGIPLHIFHQKNSGAGAARNLCLAHAVGDFIAFLDADDFWLPKKLARSIYVLRKRKATFVAHDFYAVRPGSEERQHWRCTASSRRHSWLSGNNPRTHYFYRGFIGILTVVIRKEALLAAGGFDADHRYALDWDCWHAVMAANKGAKFVLFAEPLACYTLNPGGLTSKGYARLAEREGYLPRYVKGVARAGKVPWPLLLARGWLTIQYEVGSLLIRNRQWRQLLLLLDRAPLVLPRLMWQTAYGSYTRPNFLARIKLQYQPASPRKKKKTA